MAEPKLRFKKADDSFYPPVKVKTVGEVFKFVAEKNKDKQVDNVITNSAEYGMIPQRDFFDKDIATKDNTDGYTIIQKGDFVYNPRKSQYAPYGPFNCYRLEDKGIVSPLYTCLRPITNEVIENYLEWYFASSAWHRYIYSNGAQGGARHDRVGMTNDLMKNIPVIIPSLEEQNMISETLGAVTELISILTEEICLWEEKKKGVMQKIFSQKVRFKNENGKDFPKWEEKKLSKVSQIYDGIHQTPNYVESGIPFVSVENIESLYSTRKFITKEAFDKQFKIKPTTGDIFMTRIGDVGRACLVTSDIDLAYYVSLALLKPINIHSEYLVQYIYSSEFQIELWKRTLHTAYPKKINKEEIGYCAVKIPCLEEQQKISDCLSSIDEVIAIKKQKLETWKNIKKGLLQQLFV